MRLSPKILSIAGAIFAQATFLKPYEECGGLGWRNVYECESGYNCNPVGTDAFPSYQCLPDTGPIILHAFPWGQCGGQNFQPKKVCPFGWDCIVANDFYHICRQNADYAPFALSPTPDLSGPGSYCGQTAIDRGYPAECIPGFTCSGPGVWGFWVCLRTPSGSASVPATTSKTGTTSSAALNISLKLSSQPTRASTSRSSTKAPIKTPTTLLVKPLATK